MNGYCIGAMFVFLFWIWVVAMSAVEELKQIKKLLATSNSRLATSPKEGA